MIETGSFESRENENSQGLANLLSQIGNTRLRMHSNRLFLFNDEIRFGNLLSWHERIDILAKAGDFQAAFKIGVEFYNGDIPVAALKIPHNIEERRTMKGLLVELLSNFVNMTVAGFDGEDTDVAHVISTTKLAVKTCIHIQEQSFLFGKIWDKYAEAGLENI